MPDGDDNTGAPTGSPTDQQVQQALATLSSNYLRAMREANRLITELAVARAQHVVDETEITRLNGELTTTLNRLAVANASLSGGSLVSVISQINALAAQMDADATRLAGVI